MDIGAKDVALKSLFKSKVRFADLFNGVLCNGGQVISADELQQTGNEDVMIVEDITGKEVVVERYRDTVMTWNDDCNLVVLAVENQDKIHYAMLVRNMLYDALSYTGQMRDVWNNIPEEDKPKRFSDEFFSRFRKNDKLYPIVTLVVYYGDLEVWDGNVDIHQMFGDQMNEQTARFLKKYAANYKVNLVNFAEIEDINVFKTDLREFSGMIKYRKDEKKMKEFLMSNEASMSRIDLEMSRVMEFMLGVKFGEKHIVEENGKKVINVCKAFEDHMLRGKIEGKIEQLIEMVVRKVALGKNLDVIVSDLDDTLENIQPIYDAVTECGIDAKVEDIYIAWESKVNVLK